MSAPYYADEHVMPLTYGSLFAGYNGLGMGVQSVLGGETSWFAEYDAAPAKILAHHHPGVPNLGDVTKVDWTSVPKVDVLDGGSPCQDLSHAGKRAGMKAGTRSGLWASMCDAIEIIRPGLVVWENVRGALSAEADSAMEPCPGCVGDPDDGPVLRALGRVLGDLAELGYDARWYGLRAADVGAPHGRFRIFVFAHDAKGNRRRSPWHQDHQAGPVDAPIGATHQPATADAKGHEQRESADATGWRDGLRVEPGDGLGVDWAQYAPAIAHWATVLGRPAPAPTEPGPKGGQRLSPRFVEWLMGIPAGHVTDVKISRNDMLKALGNGVVPQQAAEATRRFLDDVLDFTGKAS